MAKKDELDNTAELTTDVPVAHEPPKPVLLGSENENGLASNVAGLQKIVYVLIAAVVVLFLWLAWVSARTHQLDYGMHGHDTMMNQHWQSDTQGYGNSRFR